MPTQGTKQALTKRGHVLIACRFNKSMNSSQVETAINEAFGDVIPPLVDIEILQSVHSDLIKLVLGPGQSGIDGTIVHRLFKTKNKPMYVRPNRILIQELAQVPLVQLFRLSH